MFFIEGNEAGLRRTIQNILKNALDHGETGIYIALFREENRIILQVKNEAAHPEEIDVSQVFERFYKADAARSRTSNGLGLSIAKEFVVRMHGEITARIEGTKFCVEVAFPECVFLFG